jgi:hypothetical protein
MLNFPQYGQLRYPNLRAKTNLDRYFQSLAELSAFASHYDVTSRRNAVFDPAFLRILEKKRIPY